MKKLLLPLIFILALNVQAQKPTTKANPSQGSIKLATATDSTQYILGAYIGQYLKINGFDISKPELFNKGLYDVLTNKPMLVNADSVPKIMNKYLSMHLVEVNKAFEKQLFEKLRGKAGIGIMPSGVCYEIVKAGTGVRPTLSDSVLIQLKGYLPDGSQFEDTYAKNNPYKVTPSVLIAGMKDALQIMPSGSLWRLYIPSALAYGEKGIQGIIPPFSALIFEIELLNIIPSGNTKPAGK